MGPGTQEVLKQPVFVEMTDSHLFSVWTPPLRSSSPNGLPVRSEAEQGP